MSGIKYQFRLNEDIQNKSDELLIKTFQRSMLKIQNIAKIKAPVDYIQSHKFQIILYLKHLLLMLIFDY